LEAELARALRQVRTLQQKMDGGGGSPGAGGVAATVEDGVAEGGGVAGGGGGGGGGGGIALPSTSTSAAAAAPLAAAALEGGGDPPLIHPALNGLIIGGLSDAAAARCAGARVVPVLELDDAAPLDATEREAVLALFVAKAATIAQLTDEGHRVFVVGLYKLNAVDP
jgi:hypothetical protein